MTEPSDIIDAAWENRAELTPSHVAPEALRAAAACLNKWGSKHGDRGVYVSGDMYFFHNLFLAVSPFRTPHALHSLRYTPRATLHALHSTL